LLSAPGIAAEDVRIYRRLSAIARMERDRRSRIVWK
jgi:hypothetical protein